MGANAARRLRTRGRGAKMMVLEGENAQPRCLVSSARETDQFAVVNTVFTPAEWRRKGCAARAVGAACKVLLEEKPRIALFADANAVGPNSLYQQLGFAVTNTSQSWVPDG